MCHCFPFCPFYSQLATRTMSPGNESDNPALLSDNVYNVSHDLTPLIFPFFFFLFFFPTEGEENVCDLCRGRKDNKMNGLGEPT